MAEISYSKAGIQKASEEFNTAFEKVKMRFAEIDREFSNIKEKWTGAESENARVDFQNADAARQEFEKNLKDINDIMANKAEMFNNIHY